MELYDTIGRDYGRLRRQSLRVPGSQDRRSRADEASGPESLIRGTVWPSPWLVAAPGPSEASSRGIALTLFEYAMVLVSIVLALGVAQLLGGASEFVRSSRVYLGHSFWVLALFLIHVQLWWAMWDLHDRASWTFLTFLYLLLGPTLLFFATNLLFPRNATGSMDWESHFFAVRRWFFVSMGAIVVWGIFVTWIVGGVPLSHPYRIAQSGRLLFFLPGIASANRRLHVWLPVGYVLYFVATTLMFRFLPTLSPA